MNAQLSDAEFEAIKETINTTIHELVFAAHHAEENNIEDAMDALRTAAGNIDSVMNKIGEKPS